MILSHDIAYKLFEKIQKNLTVKMCIIDQNGVVAAGYDNRKVGQLDQNAYDIICQYRKDQEFGLEKEIVSGNDSGSIAPIVFEGKVIGAICMSGQEEEIQYLIYAVKTSIEVMLENERYQETVNLRRNKSNIFLNSLLFKPNFSDDELKVLATTLGFQDDILRIPILIEFDSQRRIEKYIFRKNPHYSRQDIIFFCMDGSIVVFKKLKTTNYEHFSNIKLDIEMYITGLKTVFNIQNNIKSLRYYVGSIQKQMGQYYKAYHHALWLRDNSSADEISFFYDHLADFILSKIPPDVYHEVYSFFMDFFDEGIMRILPETMKALMEADVSITDAAENLGLHRNTMIQRLNKIEYHLGLNPARSCYDRFFLWQVCRYIEYKKEQ